MIKLSEMIVFLYQYISHERIKKDFPSMKIYQRKNRKQMTISDRIC